MHKGGSCYIHYPSQGKTSTAATSLCTVKYAISRHQATSLTQEQPVSGHRASPSPCIQPVVGMVIESTQHPNLYMQKKNVGVLKRVCINNTKNNDKSS